MGQDRYGAPDVVTLREVAAPRPAAGEVLVRVVAAGAHMGDWHVCVGEPYLVRVMGFGLHAPAPAVRGTELAGVVSEVGADVTDVRVGDEVFGFGVGTFAEFACAEAGKLAPKPARLTFDEAAVLPVSGTTAVQALGVGGGVRPGMRVLVLGAGGGVGTFAVQIAKADGAEVTGVCSTGKVDLVRSLGADRVIDYTSGDVAPVDGGYDLVIDTGGNRSLARLRRLLAPRGTLVIVGGEGGGRWLGPAARLLGVAVLNAFTPQVLHGLMAGETRRDLLALAARVEAGTLTPVVGRTFELAEAADALRYLGEGHAHGKVVVRVARDGPSRGRRDDREAANDVAGSSGHAAAMGRE